MAEQLLQRNKTRRRESNQRCQHPTRGPTLHTTPIPSGQILPHPSPTASQKITSPQLTTNHHSFLRWDMQTMKLILQPNPE
ncbi:hypothetical protein RHMOL_Rhmol02G0175400 [Rhododendron molle]|uniref:Uncharacterized protein n=1 Tax=Rhododendron molle TaxID=49168 RepID=A0ACC0PTQ0_RHOML|nr:hypothetical protein RHMOL_Rhmol02G0175400 [Rhododendron molle]